MASEDRNGEVSGGGKNRGVRNGSLSVGRTQREHGSCPYRKKQRRRIVVRYGARPLPSGSAPSRVFWQHALFSCDRMIAT